MRHILIAPTQKLAKLRAPEGVEPIGVGNQVFQTPDKVTFTPILLDERNWNWLMNDVNLFSVKEVTWELP